MTYEQAVCFKLFLMCGYRAKLDAFLDKAMDTQDPISDIVLDLIFAGADQNKTSAVLNDYIRQISDEQINYDTVFQLILAELQDLYFNQKMPIRKLASIMYRIPVFAEKT